MRESSHIGLIQMWNSQIGNCPINGVIRAIFGLIPVLDALHGAALHMVQNRCPIHLLFRPKWRVKDCIIYFGFAVIKSFIPFSFSFAFD